MQDLTVTIDKQPDAENVYVAHFEGAFDGHIREPIEELDKLIHDNEGIKCAFDFEKLSFLNSYAIGSLVAWHNHVIATKGQIVIAAPAKNVEDIFNIVGIATMLKIFPDVESALNSLKQ